MTRNWNGDMILYVQSPEKCDDQGVYVKDKSEDEPWEDETDIEEFDYILANAPIHDEASAQKWANAEYKNVGTITLIWI